MRTLKKESKVEIFNESWAGLRDIYQIEVAVQMEDLVGLGNLRSPPILRSSFYLH